jgi:hypothetical protein
MMCTRGSDRIDKFSGMEERERERGVKELEGNLEVN